MCRPRIYLAGPITGLSYEDATQWRIEAASALPDVRCFSPMRAKQAQSECKKLGWSDNAVNAEDPIFTIRGIVTRDYLDCTQADLVLMNFEPCAPEVSVGGISEISWAWAAGVPTIVIAKEGNIHDQKWIRELAPFWTDNMDDALRLVRTILFP